MAMTPNIKRLLKSRVSIAELGIRGSLRIAKTLLQVYPRAARWLLKRQRPPANELRELFESLGATYIKFGQFIASSPSVFPSEYVEEFQLLLDQTSSIEFDKIKVIIEKDLKQPIDKIFKHIDPIPLASASIAQVHAATLLSGEDVVVKVQKPGVETEIMVDLNTVYLMVRIMELMMPHIDRDAIAGIVEEMYQAMIDECDFKKEADNLDHFRQFLFKTGNRDVVAPKPYRQASNTRVLTMERFYGSSITDQKNLDSNTSATSIALFSALNTWFASLTNCDFFHADLHSGNMLLLEDGRVGFIDFGMVGRVNKDAWEAMFSLFAGISANDYRLIADSMLKVGITRDEVDIDKLTKDITELFQSLNEVDPEKLLSNISKNKSDGINDMIVKIGEIGKNYGIRFPRAFTMLLKQFMYFDRYMQMLEPNASVFDDDRIQMHPGLM